MKNESQAITESFNVENTLNKSLMDSASIQRSWCCNIPKCFADSSVQADEEPRKNPSLITKTATVEGVRLTFSQDNDEGIRSKRKWSGKSKGLNMKRKIRRTFTLCCYHGQSVSSDEDEEENVYTGDSREDETSQATAEDKDLEVHVEQKWNKEKKEPELFWKILNPFIMPDEDIPTNILQVYADNACAQIAPNNGGQVFDNNRNRLGLPQYGYRPSWDPESDSSYSTDDSSYSSSYGSCSTCGAVLEDLETTSSSSESFPADYRFNTNSGNKNMHFRTARTETETIQHLPEVSAVDSLPEIEQTSSDMVPLNPTNQMAIRDENEPSLPEQYFKQTSSETDASFLENKTEFSGGKEPPISFNSQVIAIETDARNTIYEHISDVSDLYKMFDEDADTSEFIALVFDWVTSGRVGFKRNLADELDNDEESFMVDFEHLNSGLPYEQVKKFLNKVSELVNTKHIKFVYSNDPKPSPWFRVKSFLEDKLTLSQEDETTESNENDNHKQQLQTRSGQISDDNTSNFNAETLTPINEMNNTRAEEKGSNCLSDFQDKPDVFQTVQNGTFSSVLDDIKKAREKEVTHFTETDHLTLSSVSDVVGMSEDVGVTQLPDFELAVNDRSFSNVLDDLYQSNTGCVSTLHDNCNEGDPSAVLNSPVTAEELDIILTDIKTPCSEITLKEEIQTCMLNAVTEGLANAYLEEPAGQAQSSSDQMLSSPLKRTPVDGNQPIQVTLEETKADKEENAYPVCQVEDSLLKTSESNQEMALSLSPVQAASSETIIGKSSRSNAEDPALKSDQETAVSSFDNINTDVMSDVESKTENDNMSSNISFVESALPKEPPGRLKQNIGCLRSKKHELNGPWALEMNDSETTEADEWKTVAKFANSKAIRGVSNLNVTPGLVQPNKNRNTPQWNLSDRATLSSGANKQTVVNTGLGSFKALANAYTTEATKNQTNLSASGIDGSEINNRRIKTAKRRLKKSTKVEDESSPTVSMQPEVNQSRDPLKTEVSQSAAPSKPKVPKSSVPPKPESYQSNVPTQAQTFSPPLTSKPAFDQQAASLQSEGNRSTMPLHSEATQSASKHQNKQKDSRLRPLHFVDTDGDTSSLKVNEAPPIFIETDATIDYGRCVVEPGHGERPDKKKLRAEIKEKVKTKGEANKHLKTEKENYFPLYEDVMEAYFADSGADIDVSIDDGNASEEETEGARAASPIVLNAVDQPQVLDDREMNMVPETIKRVDDPYLVDVEEDYKVSTTHSNKKDKRKQKDERRKEKKNKKANQTILKFS